jgi:GTP:adenosylcobinamide-phosphate guanylyltransferase
MVNRLGVIPAAGKAMRFGGIPKELLPVADGATLIKRTLTAMFNGGCDTCLVVTNRDKMITHASHLEGWNVYFAEQKGKRDIWSAMVESFPICGKENLFAMPDTYIPADVFIDFMDGDFTLGVFETWMPERFGVITETGVVNKQKLPAGIYSAWGVLGWSNKVVKFWVDHIEHIETYTHAINMAMSKFGYKLKPMDFYYDLAGWSDYQEFVRGQL